MLTLAAAAALAVALHLLPLAAYLPALGRAAPATGLARLLDVGVVLSADALLVLTLARFMTLEHAVWLSRAVLVAAGAALAAKYRPRPRLDAGAVVTVLAASATTALALWRTSYLLVMWDRDWHIPLASSLRVGRVPFTNVYLPDATLRYHYLGDVIAAELQTLSGDVINAGLAFSVAHDLYLAMACSVAALALREVSPRRGWWFAPLVALALAFASPMVLLHLPPRELFTTHDSALLCGYSFLPYASYAYRPHVVVAGLHLVLLVVAVAARARDPRAHSRRVTVAMFASAASLALLDEASLLVFALGLLGAYQVVPSLLHARPRGGLYLSIGLVATLFVVSRAFHASLSPGGPAQEVALVPARHLGLFGPPVPFANTREALRVLAHDYFPIYAAVAVLALFALRTRRPDHVALFWVYGAMTAAAAPLLFKFEFNHDPGEGHRFLVALMLLSPLVCLYALCAAPEARALRALAALVVAATAASGLLWYQSFLRHRFAAGAPQERVWTGRQNPLAVNCRELLGAFDRRAPVLEYVEHEAFYAYAGCQPGRFAGRRGPWPITVNGALFGPEARAAYRQSDADGRLAAVVCAARNPAPEPACAWATEHLRCAPLPHGSLVRCPLDATTRGAFLDALSR